MKLAMARIQRWSVSKHWTFTQNPVGFRWCSTRITAYLSDLFHTRITEPKSFPPILGDPQKDFDYLDIRKQPDCAEFLFD